MSTSNLLDGMHIDAHLPKKIGVDGSGHLVEEVGVTAEQPRGDLTHYLKGSLLIFTPSKPSKSHSIFTDISKRITLSKFRDIMI